MDGAGGLSQTLMTLSPALGGVGFTIHECVCLAIWGCFGSGCLSMCTNRTCVTRSLVEE